MVGQIPTDEIDCGGFFDNFDDLVEFPPVSDCCFESCDKDFPPIWPYPPDGLPESDPLFSGSHSNSASNLSAELSVPYEDILQLEWLSTFVEDSFSGGGMTLGKEYSLVSKKSSHNQFKISSPVSVLESSRSSSSSSSCSGEKMLPLTPGHRGPQRARSKRSRPTIFTPRSTVQLISPSSSLIETPGPFAAPVASSESDNFAEFQPVKKIPNPAASEQKKKKKIKLSPAAVPIENNQNSNSQAVRKCLHCEITKTPQWRAGPMGPKTLCNACGVRYKSGRLFPEYRPAASPTFVPSLHSNSHKKVVEMRNNAVISNTATINPEIIPNYNLSLEHV